MIINDNLLDPAIFNFVVDKVKKSPWYFLERTGTAVADDAPSFYMIISDENGIYSSLYDLLCVPLMVACSKNNIKFSKLLRIRVGMITGCKEQIIHTPHVDYTYPHKTMLFYLTDSDAPTLFFDKIHSGIINDVGNCDIDSVKVKESVIPVKNTSVIFDGLNFHSSTTPKENFFRIVINYNFVD